MIAKGGVITKGAEKKFTEKQVKDMSIKCREIGQNVGDLSGGNNRKLYLENGLVMSQKFISWTARHEELILV